MCAFSDCPLGPCSSHCISITGFLPGRLAGNDVLSRGPCGVWGADGILSGLFPSRSQKLHGKEEIKCYHPGPWSFPTLSVRDGTSAVPFLMDKKDCWAGGHPEEVKPLAWPRAQRGGHRPRWGSTRLLRHPPLSIPGSAPLGPWTHTESPEDGTRVRGGPGWGEDS